MFNSSHGAQIPARINREHSSMLIFPDGVIAMDQCRCVFPAFDTFGCGRSLRHVRILVGVYLIDQNQQHVESQ